MAHPKNTGGRVRLLRTDGRAEIRIAGDGPELGNHWRTEDGAVFRFWGYDWDALPVYRQVIAPEAAPPADSE